MRIQIEIPDDKFHEIEALIKECGFATKKDFFDNAITLLKWAVRQAKKGNLIASVDERADKYTELQMPFLESVRPRQMAAQHHAAA